MTMPHTPAGTALPDGRTPVVLSAHAEDLIGADAAAIAGYLQRRPAMTDVSRVAATLLRTRRVRRHRTLIRAADIGELIVFNKADIADPVALSALLRAHPGALAVSAATGAGIAELEARIAELLPEPEHELTVLLPYDRGDLVSRIHDEGTVLEEKHLAEGTAVQARVDSDLLSELEEYRKPDMFSGPAA